MTVEELTEILDNLNDVECAKVENGLEEYGDLFWKFNDATQKLFIRNCLGGKK